MTECNGVQEDLKAYQDGQLSSARRMVVRLHLAKCATCRKELEEMEKIGKRLRTADVSTLGQGMRDRLLAQIPAGSASARPSTRRPLRRRPLILWGAAASAALASFIYTASTNIRSQTPPAGAAIQEHKVGDTLAVIGLGFKADRSAHGGDVGAMPGPSEEPNSPPKSMPGPAGMSMGTAEKQPLGESDVSLQRQQVAEANAGRGGIGGKQPAVRFRWAADGDQTVDSLKQKPTTVDSPTVYFNAVDGHTPMGNVPAAPPSPAPVTLAAAAPMAGVGGRGTLPRPTTSQANNAAVLLDADGLPTERQVHHEANITVEVADVEAQSETVSRITQEAKGYVAQNQLSTDEDHLKTATLTVKVPVDQFETVLNQFTHLGEVTAKSLSGEDITDKVTDEEETSHVLHDDINTTEQRLKQRESRSATSHDEESLRQLKIRIAKSQARLKMLTRLGNLSDITVELDQKRKVVTPPPPPPSGMMAEISSTMHSAADTFVTAIRLPVQVLVWVIVYAPIWAILWIAYKRAVRS